MLRRLIFASIRLALTIFFRRIEVTGDVPAPGTRSRLLYANHHNGLIDPALILGRAPVPISPLAKSTLWKTAVLRPFLAAARAVPVQRRQDVTTADGTIDNRAMFARVIERLDEGGNILIFPEGISHNAPAIASFKTGAARMLLGTAPDADVTVQPVHLGYDHKTLFRSRALVCFGEPVALRDLVAAADSDDERERVRAVTDQMQAALEREAAFVGDWDAQRLLDRVATLATHAELDPRGDGRAPSLEARREAFLRARAAWRVLREREDADIAATRAAIDTYFDALYASGLDDHDVVRGRRRHAVAGLTSRLVTSALLLPLAVLGFALFAPAYALVHWGTGRLAKEADEVSSIKLLAGYLAYPMFATVYIAVASVWLGGGWASWCAAAVIVASAFAALAMFERLTEAAHIWRWLATHLTHRRRLEALRAQRRAVIASLAELEARALDADAA